MLRYALRLSIAIVAASSASPHLAWAWTSSAATENTAPQTIPFADIHPGEPAGDRLEEPRRLAAAIAYQDDPAAASVVDIGSDTGEFLEAFLAQFPNGSGQWTEPVTRHRAAADQRLARFGQRVRYVIGCPSRRLGRDCIPAGTSILITSWLQVHQGIAGIQTYYRTAFDLLPSGAWVANIDHIRSDSAAWDSRFAGAKIIAAGEHLNALGESPPTHRMDPQMPTIE